ncbi:MAG: nucleoside phosphorylase [Acidobacteriota bacterium]
MDNTQAVIEPRRGKREEPLPPVAVLIFTPQDVEFFIRCLPSPPRRTHKLFLVDVYTCQVGEETAIALAGPVLGAPQAVMVVERLVALGVRRIVAVGWCGSLQPHVAVGDVVLPTGAISEEGTSAHYPLVEGRDPGPAPGLLSSLRESLLSRSLRIHEGRVWSTDAPFRETVGKVSTYQKENILAVDMETSALFTLAAFRSFELAVAMVVSDDLSSLKWVHGFRDRRFKEAREILARTTFDVVCSTIGRLST